MKHLLEVLLYIALIAGATKCSSANAQDLQDSQPSHELCVQVHNALVVETAHYQFTTIRQLCDVLGDTEELKKECWVYTSHTCKGVRL